MSEFSYELRTSPNGRSTKCCMCANSIKKGEPYFFATVRKHQNFNYCQRCWAYWKPWVPVSGLRVWAELVNSGDR